MRTDFNTSYLALCNQLQVLQELTARYLEQLSTGISLTLAAFRPATKSGAAEVERITKVLCLSVTVIFSTSGQETHICAGMLNTIPDICNYGDHELQSMCCCSCSVVALSALYCIHCSLVFPPNVMGPYMSHTGCHGVWQCSAKINDRNSHNSSVCCTHQHCTSQDPSSVNRFETVCNSSREMVGQVLVTT